MASGINHERGNDINPGTVSYTITGGSHGTDIEVDPDKSVPSPALKVVQNFEAILQKWLAD